MPDQEKTDVLIANAENAAQARFEEDQLVVLLVDDQPMIGEAVRRLLAKETQITFHYCSKSQEALEKASTIGPNVILQDLVMPEIDGLELLKQYRATPATRSVPVIVLSTKEDPDVKKQAFELGATDYLVKLPDPIELIARIRSHSKAHLHHMQRDAAIKALNLALREKSEFLRIASHDLKNPLTVVIGAAGLVRTWATDNPDGKHNENIGQMIATISRQTEQMRKLISDYLDAQAVEDGQLKFDYAQTDLNEIVRNAVSDLQSYIDSKKTAVQLQLDEALPPGYCDAARVMQVIINILSNSVKFSPHGSTVVLRTQKLQGDALETPEKGSADKEFVVLEIEDNGPGLAPQDLENLFGRYARLTAKPTGGEKSTGLGLSICKSLVELQGGHIGARNNPEGAGATFWFALPVESGSIASPA